MADKFERYHSAQGWFAKNSELYRSPRRRALEIVCKKVCEVMDISRFGVWMYNGGTHSLLEEITFTASFEFTQGTSINRDLFPDYFKEVDKEKLLLVDVDSPNPDLTYFIDSS